MLSIKVVAGCFGIHIEQHYLQLSSKFHNVLSINMEVIQVIIFHISQQRCPSAYTDASLLLVNVNVNVKAISA